DRPRPPVPTYAGARAEFVLPAGLVGRLTALGRARGATLFTTVAAGLLALLHRYTGQTDLCIGTPVMGRSRVAEEGAVGCFINTLPLRVDLAGAPRVEELLARVSASVAEVRAHQGVPFERIVEALALPRSLGRAPLFQVLLAMEPTAEPVSPPPGLSLAVERVDTGTAQFELTLELATNAEGARCAWEYNTDLFDAATIARMTRHLLALLGAFVETPRAALASLPLLDANERRQLLVDWNATERTFPNARPVHALFEERARLAPDHTALLFEDQRLTYGELNCRANQLAHALRRRGAGPDRVVAVCAERSLELVVALLAVFKAGAAYLPLDPDAPPERLAFTLDDAEASLVIGPQTLVSRLPPHRS
ncbi:MAG TPA: condensation domain-containing protein, partial [Polyangiaceae bacterium]|nr:condensation domain-containing protein [Polyangiaceae bacterium]